MRTSEQHGRCVPPPISDAELVDLRLRYRTQFREVLGEQRGNQVFGHQEKFIKELRDLRRDRLGDRPLRRNEE